MATINELAGSKLATHIGFWMRLVSNQVSHSFARRLENSGVTVAEWVVLSEISRSSPAVTSPGNIAEITGLSRGAISKLVDRLWEKGLVTRKPSSGDRRYQDIQLTKKAMLVIPKLVAIADENDEFFFSVLSLKERKILTKTLIKLANLHKLTKLPLE